MSRILPVAVLAGGALATAGGLAGFAVSRSLARTDEARAAEFDRKLLAEAGMLSDAASDRLSMAAAWAQAAQALHLQQASGEDAARETPKPPVAKWHRSSTVIREPSRPGTGLLARLGDLPWTASRLADGSLQIVSRLQSDAATSEAQLLLSNWSDGLVAEVLSAQSARSDSGSIVARIWLSADESFGNGSAAVDSVLLRALFSGEKLRGFGALEPSDEGAKGRRVAFDRSEQGSVVATVDAASPAPVVLAGWLGSWCAPWFAALSLAGAMVAAGGGVLFLRRPSLTLPGPARRSEAKDVEPTIASPAPSPSMGTGAESAGAPVFLPSSAIVSAGVDSRDSELSVDAEEVQELRLRVIGLERELESARRIIRVMQDEDRVVFEFEREAVMGRDARLLGDRLARAASKLCGNPALYLQFQAPLGALSLVAESGVAPALVPAQLHVPIDAEACNRIAELAQEGSIPSLAGYEPLAQAVLRHFGASHFDAWAITGYSWLGRAAGKPKLIGVLVLLQPGSETLTRVRSLGRMVRNVGLLFENTLISQQ